MSSTTRSVGIIIFPPWVLAGGLPKSFPATIVSPTGVKFLLCWFPLLPNANQYLSGYPDRDHYSCGVIEPWLAGSSFYLRAPSTLHVSGSLPLSAIFD